MSAQQVCAAWLLTAFVVAVAWAKRDGHMYYFGTQVGLCVLAWPLVLLGALCKWLFDGGES